MKEVYIMRNKIKVKLPEISIIAAVSNDGVIGVNGKIPWDIPEDMKHFKNITSQNTVIMGRKTFESIGYPLPNRINIVVSSQASIISQKYRDERLKGIILVENLEKAIGIGAIFGRPIYLIGGSRIYKEGLKYANTLYITRVNKTFLINIHDHFSMFPLINRREWKITSSKYGNDCNDIDYRFEILKKRNLLERIIYGFKR